MRSGDLVRSGLPGLDYLLGGGFPAGRIYLVQGATGSGKTTLAMQFAMEGARAGETVLHVTLAESPEEIEQISASHGWDLRGVTVFAPKTASDQGEVKKDQYTLFHPGEVELTDLVSELVAKVAAIEPKRVVIDSLAEVRLLARDPLILMRQMRLLRASLNEAGCTVLLLNSRQTANAAGSLETFAHGIIDLEYSNDHYGATRRSISVIKLRGAEPVSGRHDMALVEGGMRVFPRLVPTAPHRPDDRGMVSSGSKELDELCGGGLERGSSAMIVGPAGTGKSTVASEYALAAAERGEHTAMYVFDETESSWRMRWESMNMPLYEHVDRGTVEMHSVDPTTMSPGEFCHRVRVAVERRDARIVIIDSLSGYMHVMPQPRFMKVHLFELLKYLNSRGVLSLLVVTQHGILGSTVDSPIDVSYLIDTVILMRYFESEGEVRKAVSVVKKRLGKHEKAIRECRIGTNGLQVGEPLTDFHGVLSGIPAFVGTRQDLM